MQRFVDFLKRRERAKTIKLLCSVDPARLVKFGESCLFPAFKRAATRVSAYKKILKDSHIDYRDIKDIPTFKKRIPLIDKHSVFAASEIEDICVDGRLDQMKLAMTSSGFSGVFSYGINTPRNYRDTARSIDTAMDYIFDISRKKTLLVNSIPMGVKVTTSLRLAETSVRPDMALAIIKKFSPKFDQTLIVSDPHFLKKLLEDGLAEGMNWKKLRVSLVSGEDWFSESFRSYLAHLLELDLDNPDGRLVGATMGIAELDLNLFHESRHSIAIRRLAQKDETLRKQLFGDGVKACPLLFHYYPHRIFLEALPENADEKELVFSMLSPHMLIPLIRYNSKDRGDIIPYNTLKEILTRANRQDLIPELKLPLVWVGGRKDRFCEIRGKKIYPEDIKQGLYEDFQAASQTTGYFKINKESQSVELQLKKGVLITEELNNRFKKALLKYTDADLPIVLYPYASFPYGMELDYEKKFKNI